MTDAVPEIACPVCHGPLPAPAATGRPRIYCGAACTELARARMRRAGRLLELADRLSTRVGDPAFGSAAYVRGRVKELRKQARELIASIGAAPKAGRTLTPRGTTTRPIARRPLGSHAAGEYASQGFRLGGKNHVLRRVT